MSTTEVVQFNIGGTKYEVSRSLLNTFPDTMLARSASDQWQADPNTEIFIERDGEIFRHVLSYLRDGKVILPLNVPKAAVLAEMKYYGIEDISDDALDDSEKKCSQSLEGVVSFLKDLEEIISQNKKTSSTWMMKVCCSVLARKCVQEFFLIKQDGRAEMKFQISESRDKQGYENGVQVRNYGQDGIDECNMYLGKVGLRVKSISQPYSSTYIYLIVDLERTNPISSAERKSE